LEYTAVIRSLKQLCLVEECVLQCGPRTDSRRVLSKVPSAVAAGQGSRGKYIAYCGMGAWKGTVVGRFSSLFRVNRGRAHLRSGRRWDTEKWWTFLVECMCEIGRVSRTGVVSYEDPADGTSKLDDLHSQTPKRAGSHEEIWKPRSILLVMLH
jgi:hypothetical protein